ncbi:MAG: hypothetical protein ACRD5G_15790 [Candidatus Acidiferrales bacterium]
MRRLDALLVKSFLSGVLITSLLTWVGFSSGSRVVFWLFAWHVALMVKLVGPGPLLGYDKYSNPMYEGTPIHMLAALLGMSLGFLVYWLLSFLVLWGWPRAWPKVTKQ